MLGSNHRLLLCRHSGPKITHMDGTSALAPKQLEYADATITVLYFSIKSISF